MSDVTIKWAALAKEKAEQEITEILTRLSLETGAIGMETNLRCVRMCSTCDSNSRLYVERFEIRLEI